MTTGIQAALFDVDGTLIDSNDSHTRAWKEILDQVGIRNTYEEIRALIGLGSDHLLPKLTGMAAETHRAQELAERKSKVFQEKYLPNLKPFPQVKDLLIKMRSLGLRLAAVSSAKNSELDTLLAV